MTRPSGLRLAVAGVALLGVVVAGYLVYVHYAGVKPLCVSGGGGCEKVQSSDQSKLAGVPVAVLGLVGYVLILLTSLVRREAARLTGAVLALGGFGFSAYLTYAEVFQIKAICQWCVGSAVLMTILAVLTCARLLLEDDGRAVSASVDELAGGDPAPSPADGPSDAGPGSRRAAPAPPASR